MRFSYTLLASISVVLTVCNAAPVELDVRSSPLQVAPRTGDSLTTLLSSRDIELEDVFARMHGKAAVVPMRAGPVCIVNKGTRKRSLSRRTLPTPDTTAPELGEKIGGGAFGEVYLCKTNPNEVVIKKPAAMLRFLIEPEVERLHAIGQLKGWAEANSVFYIKMTRIHGEHLSKFPLYTSATGQTKKNILNRIHELLFQRIMHYKDEYKLLHTDTKEENFLIQGTSVETLSVELVDWGIADNLKTCTASKTDEQIKQSIAMIV